jgi:single-strand DNA-binding protein
MAGSVNKVILIGNLGKDPEIRRTQDGPPDRKFERGHVGILARQGNWRAPEKTEWHRVVIFNEGLCRIAEQYLKKGSKGLSRRLAADTQMAGSIRARQVLHRSGAAGFNSQLTMLDRAGGGGEIGSDDAGGGDFGLLRSVDARAQAGDGRRRQAQRHGRRDSVLTEACRILPSLRRRASGNLASVA